MSFVGNFPRHYARVGLLLIAALLLCSANKCSLSEDVMLGGAAARTDGTDGDVEEDTDDDSGEGTDDGSDDDSAVDDDGDGLSNIVESTFLIDSAIADTDQDGYSDGLEFAVNSGDPLDGSAAPVSLNRSRILSSDELVINDPDRDLDGIGDTFENQIGTDINRPDTDGDGYSDAIELIAGSDPLDPESRPSRTNPPLSDGIDRFGAGPADLDGDGLSEDIERLSGTSPTDRDSDDDGYSDGVEVIMGSAADDPFSVPAFESLPNDGDG